MAEPEQTIQITIDDVLPKLFARYIDAEKELADMWNFIRENCKDYQDVNIDPPKHIRKRYGLYPNTRHPGLAWYLLDEYFKGNITIKKDVQSER